MVVSYLSCQKQAIPKQLKGLSAVQLRTRDAAQDVTIVQLVVASEKVHVFCRRHILGRLQDLSAPTRQAVMLHALSHLPLMVAEDHKVLDHLRVTPFVDTESGRLQPPGVLYDPR